MIFRALAATALLSVATPGFSQAVYLSSGQAVSTDLVKKLRAQLESEVQRKQTYQTLAQIESSVVADSQYTGVGRIFVSLESTATTGFGSGCTASLVNSRTLLTAAHCVTSPGDPITGITLNLPAARNAAGTTEGRVNVEATGYIVHPDWTGGVLDGADVALVYLSEAPVGVDIYSLYGGTGEFNNDSYEKIGAGTIGLGSTGRFQTVAGQPPEPSSNDGRKRLGKNIYEFTWAEVEVAYYAYNGIDIAPACDANGLDYWGLNCNSILTFDMDSGDAFNDIFGLYLDKPQLGVVVDGVLVDANSSGGDSGGPTFIDGKIAGVTSFGITGGIFEGLCGDGWPDPSFSRDPDTGAGDSCTDSSWGEISGDARVSTYRDWLDPLVARNFGNGVQGYVAFAAFVPEPASWAMMITGFGLVGLMARRRRQTLPA